MVWLEPVPLNSPGRSAVMTIKGMLAWLASTTAGSRLATAVPDDVTTTAGCLQEHRLAGHDAATQEATAAATLKLHMRWAAGCRTPCSPG